MLDKYKDLGFYLDNGELHFKNDAGTKFRIEISFPVKDSFLGPQSLSGIFAPELKVDPSEAKLCVFKEIEYTEEMWSELELYEFSFWYHDPDKLLTQDDNYWDWLAKMLN